MLKNDFLFIFMFSLISTFICQVLANDEECPALENGTVINHYVLRNCAACTRFSPVMEDVLSHIQRADLDIKYRKVVCNDCDCDNIKSFPSVEITDDKAAVSKIEGYKPFKDILKWISTSLKLESSLLNENHIESEFSKVKKLTAQDFLGGFDGEWLVLFYDKYSEPKRKLFELLAEKFTNIHVGEAHSEEIKDVAARFNIVSYPHITAINHGTTVPFTEETLFEFANKLASPSFINIDYNQLKKSTENHKNGEPVYLVVYKNYEIASHYFNQLAQQFKFKATIHRSNDTAIFEKTGFVPEEESDDHNKLVKLFVYKNGTFFSCPYRLDQSSEIIQWIFHSHFSHLTDLSNSNFYSVFHGIKPVIILLTNNEKFYAEFNQISADRHLGAPFSDILFVTVDISKYPHFKENVLKKVTTPNIAVYDPLKSKWYYENIKLDGSSFKNRVLSTIEKYFNNKLPEYPPKESKMKLYLGVVFILGIGIAVIQARKTQRKLSLE
ncbi:hypothetical protein NUSPORA_01468 [Nucleospora cyclopteri]